MSVKRSPELRPGVWDALVVLAVICLAAGTAAAVWGGGTSSGALRAVIDVDGEREELVLAGAQLLSRTIHANGCTLEICAVNGEVWVERSDCPTQDCVHTGHISRSGQSIVCLPARVIITLEGAEERIGPDIVIG